MLIRFLSYEMTRNYFLDGLVKVEVDGLPLLAYVFLVIAGELVPLIVALPFTDPFALVVSFLVALAVVGFIKLKFELGVALLLFMGLPGVSNVDVDVPPREEEAMRIGLDLATDVVVIVVMFGDDIVVRNDPFLDISVRLKIKRVCL